MELAESFPGVAFSSNFALWGPKSGPKTVQQNDLTIDEIKHLELYLAQLHTECDFLSGCDTVPDFLRRVSDVIRTCLNHVRMYQYVHI